LARLATYISCNT